MASTGTTEGLMNLEFVTVETFLIQFVILLTVLWVLNKFVFKPYLAYLDEWEAKQKKVQDDYKNAEGILEQKRKEGDILLEQARTKGNALIEESESLALAKKDKILLDAEKQAGETLSLAQKQIDTERQSMLSQIKGSVIDLSVKLNGKLFQDGKASREFLEKHIDSL